MKNFEEGLRDLLKKTHSGGGSRRDDNISLVLPNIKLEKLIPTFSLRNSDRLDRARYGNKYLGKQYRRIERHIQKGDIRKAWNIGLVLFQRSDSYLVLGINRSLKGGYRDRKLWEIMKILQRVKKICRTLDTVAIYDRVYIPKPSGKLRPLGVPRREGRVVIGMIQDFVSRTVEPKIGDNQHGFRKKKGVVTAGQDLVKRVLGGQIYLYEFDLKACFNRISMNQLMFILEKYYGYSSDILNYLHAMVTNPPLFKELEREEEVKPVSGSPNGKWLKYGLPQGGSLSPILSIAVIDVAMRIFNPVMYADDGIITSTFKAYPNVDSVQQLKFYGIYFEESKTGHIEDIFTFLGVQASLKQRCFNLGDLGWVSGEDENVGELLSKFYLKSERNYFGEELKKDGDWTILEDSGLGINHPVLSSTNFWGMLEYFIGNKAYKKFGWRFINYMEASSYACLDLLRISSEGRKAKKLIRFREKFDFKDDLPYGYTVNREYFHQANKFGVYNYHFMADVDRRYALQTERLGAAVMYEDPYFTERQFTNVIH